MDVTYIPMTRGFVHLAAIMDWDSCKILSWRLFNTRDASYCADALQEAIKTHGPPEIFNNNRGSRFTCEVHRRAETSPHPYQHGL